MTLTSVFPTPYSELNELLHLLLDGARAALGFQFTGLYLHGSLASGDFDLERSDVDFAAVTDGEIQNERIFALEEMHARLAVSGLKWADRLEGSYIPMQTLRRYTPTDPPRPQVDGSRFYLACHCVDWVIQRHVLREHAVIVAGPNPRPWIDPVSPDELRWAVREFVQGWWAPMLDDPGRLSSDEYRAYAVLTMCRALYTLEHGAIASKPASARWAQGVLGEGWTALIGRSLTWRPGEAMGDHEEALALIRYVVEQTKT
jgi:hypothetical protein